jgi:hypothetical protein
MLANNPYLGAQVLTIAIPLGTLIVVLLAAFFVRRPQS